MTSLELDHVFVFVEPDHGRPGGRVYDELVAGGLVETYRRRHEGQGTANVCFVFDNAFLELLWVVDVQEARAPDIGRAGIERRADWRFLGGSPYGIAVRTEDDLPFETWPYRFEGLPDGLHMPVATASDDLAQPFIFRSLRNRRPDRWDNGAAGERQRAAGLAEITALDLTLPKGVEPGEALSVLADAGLVRLHVGPPDALAHRMVLTLSRNDGGTPRRLDIAGFHWLDD
ncbi:VOC family protein [Methylobrevis pamukkalensis]|uniref:Glyoxalase-like domain-containing protein n=1 Tax=Methylobrevis pamukkalensis TaxID=1439726 RepID=A0A1E3H1N6_9HYPH|nr:VOC family protein [Methylobrevis pamukkalensis]ODN70248.1 hypothetical protein A6302_02459 [Methylobrevis pamukkalensis]